jgi:hypothetical protein
MLLALWGCCSPRRAALQSAAFTISPASAMVGSSDLTLTIKGSNFGGRLHALEALTPLVYNELHRLAHRYMSTSSRFWSQKGDSG